jgi:soluble lytic murein transglycosylase-like protein
MLKKLSVFLLIPVILLLFAGNSYEEEKNLLPFTDINQCFKDAGALYGVHPNLLWAIAKVESGLNPMAINRNLNGTVDIGIMQINSSWIPVLKAYGLKDERYLWEPCYNIHVGAWVLAQCIKKFGYTWEAVGCYNATSKTKRVKYSQKVWKQLKPYVRGE